MPAGTYRAWLVEDAPAHSSPAAALTIIPWPPGPQYPGDALAFVYNVYAEPAYRRRGLARLVMDAIHAWCRDHGVALGRAQRQPDGRPVCTSRWAIVNPPSPMMFWRVVGVNRCKVTDSSGSEVRLAPDSMA